MKTLRMSRSTESRNARKQLTVHSRAGTPSALHLQPEALLRGRNLRRAIRNHNGRGADRRGRPEGTAAAASRHLDALLARADGTVARPTVTVHIDPVTRMVTGYEVS